MADQLVNEFTVNRPIDEAWAVITDVERIAPCLPGAQLQEIEGDIYRGVVKIKLGSITPQFKGQANVHRARRRRPPGRAQGRGPRHRRPRQRGGRDRGRGREPVADQHPGRRHHRPAHHRQGGPVRAGDHRRRLQEADGAVRRQPEHDARRAGPTATPPARRERRHGDEARQPRRPTAPTGRRRRSDRARRRRPRPARRPAATRCARSTARPASPSTSPASPGRRSSSGSHRCSAGCSCCCSSCAAGADGRIVVDDDDRAAVRALLGREPHGHSRSSCATRPAARSSSATPPCSTTARRCRRATGWSARPRCAPSAGSRRPAGWPRRGRGRRRGARRRPRPLRRRARRRRRRPARRPCRRAGSAARARASSACTPTTPGTWPVATTRSGAGSRRRLAERLDVDIAATSTRSRHAGRDARIPVGPESLLAGELVDPDPPRPPSSPTPSASSTDHLDDVVREQPASSTPTTSTSRGDEPWHLAIVERGGAPDGRSVVVERDAAEEVFRPLATETRPSACTTRASSRSASTPCSARAACSSAVMRRLHLAEVDVRRAGG